MQRTLITAIVLGSIAMPTLAQEEQPRLTFQEEAEKGNNRNRIIVNVVKDEKTGCEYMLVSSSNGGLAAELLQGTCNSESTALSDSVENELDSR